MSKLFDLLRDNRGGSAAEFALVLPLLMILTLGTIDFGRYMWEVQQAKKAAQYGARFAVVTSPVESELLDESYVGVAVGGVTLTQGDVIPAAALGEIVCDDTSCTCTAPCLSGGTDYDAAAFDAIVGRMQLIDPRVVDTEVEVTYRGSGLGFAGDPNGADIAPLVTVAITGRQFTPITTFLLASVNMPDVRVTLTAEDLATHNGAWGSQSN